MQAHTSKTGCLGRHCDLEQHIPCLNYAFVYGFCQVLIRSAGRFYIVGALLFYDNLQTHLGALLLGRVLLIGTLQYFWLFALSNCFLASQLGLSSLMPCFFQSFNAVLISWKKSWISVIYKDLDYQKQKNVWCFIHFVWSLLENSCFVNFPPKCKKKVQFC